MLQHTFDLVPIVPFGDETIVFANASKRHRSKAFISLTLVSIAIPLFAWWNHVPTEVSERDVKYIRLILSENGHDDLWRTEAASFKDEISIIMGVQDAVLAQAPIDAGLSLNKPREPEYLYKARKGLCYDRSRTIEKTLTLMGFEVRHVAIYSTAKTGSALKSLLTPGTPSHAVSEVRTSRGWLAIDPNARWIALTADDVPVSTSELAETASVGEKQTWTSNNQSQMNKIFSKPFTYLIGLYSRHGRFYPPYTFVPDVNYNQLLQNLSRF